MKRKVFRIILTAIISALFLMSAYAMLSGNKAETAILTNLNLLLYRKTIGLLCITITLSLWNKGTRTFGILIGSAYLGGAIVSELSLGDTGFFPGVTLLALWTIWLLNKKSFGQKLPEVPNQ